MEWAKGEAARFARWLVSIHSVFALGVSLLVLFFYDPRGEDRATELRGVAILAFLASQALTRAIAWLVQGRRREGTG